ncbi:Detected protein of unknown function [Hibiscus syriacus]|uniref:Uncharacterized protein n=1 Tax=Hibiscus syriacus TaxID=106335 RepID=A0A6A3D218_HIBSY|nr:Detected protein of unknown function [Hibiscus syriacus]
MGENKELTASKYDMNDKWDACIDLGLRRFVYSSLTGAFGGLIFFRSPVTRWASELLVPELELDLHTQIVPVFLVGILLRWLLLKLDDAPAPKNQEE